MGTHTLPSDETARLGALCRYRILDSPSESAFDDLVQLAASLYKAPIAAITFIDQDRQWVKAATGLNVTQTDRAYGLCAFTIQGMEPVVIEDAQADGRFSSHTLVRDHPHVRFYCGAPIVTSDGYAVGTIAVMDPVPRTVTDEDCLTIQRLARQTAALLELRMLRSDRSSVDAASVEERIANLTEAAFLTDRSGRIIQANREAEELLGAPASELRGRLLHECVHRHGRSGCEALAGSCALVDVCRSGTPMLGQDDVFVNIHGSVLQVSWNHVPRTSHGDWVGGIVSVRDLTKQKRNEEVMGLMARTTRLTGMAFLQELVETLAHTIGADYGFCLRALPGGLRAQSVAGWGPEGCLEPIAYELEGTPCEHVLREEFCHYPSGVQALFPRDEALRDLSIESYMALTLPSPTGVPVGWIAMLGRAPLKDAERAEALLRVAAGRAGSELGRHLAEQQLKESEERYALALRGSSDGIWDWNVITGEAVLSARWKALLGFAEDELPDHGSSFFSRVHPDDVERVTAEIQTHFERRTPYDVQCRVLHKDGTYRWVQTRAQALWDEQGRAYRMVGATTDITERKQAEDGARRWQQVFDQAQLGLAHADLTTNTFLAVNPAFARQCGYTVEELVGQPVLSIYPAEEQAAVQDRIRRIHETGGLTFESIHRRKDGSLFPVLVEVMLIRDAHGMPVSRVAYVKDITESKEAEQARRASEERFRAAYRNATVGMSIAAVNGRIQEVNQALCKILGYSEQELLARTFQSLTHPDDLGQNLHRIQTLLDGTRVYDVFEKRYLRKDGRVVWAQVGVSVIRDEQGTPLHTLAMVQDITERKRTEEALQLAKYTVDHATEAIYWVGAGAELLDVNDSACAMLGYSKDEFRRMTVHDINPNFQADAWSTFWEQTRDRGRVSFESCHRAKDGRLIPIDVNVNFVRYNGVECHFAFVRDITERKSAESALRASEERFHVAIEATNDGMWDWDMRTDDVYYSPQWIRLLGYQAEDVPPSRAFFVALVHPEDVTRTREILQAHVDGRIAVQEIEVRLRQKSGEYRWYLNRGKVVAREQNGRPLRMVGTITDISERKQSERERDEALNNLQTIMETVPDVIFALDLEARVSKWNLRLETVTGYTREELQGKPALEMVPSDEAEKTAAAIQEAYEKGYAQLEGHLLAKDGRTMLYHWTGAPYRDVQGRVIGVTGVGRDITERKKVEAQLQLTQFAIERAGDMVFWLDEAARVLFVNAAACERMGYTKDELLHMAVPDIDPNYQMEAWARHWQDLRETGRQRLETQHRSKSGEVYPVEVVANFVVFEGREYNFATVRDMSERKRTELLLRSSEERFRLVAQATNDVLWDWDLVTNDHWWSPNAREKFGYDPLLEPSIDAWILRLHPEDKESILEIARQAIQSDVQTLAAEYRFRLADGTYGYFLDRAHIVRNEAGTAIRMIGAMIDVTGPKRAYASLEEAYRRFQAMSQELQMVESNERRRLSRELHDELGQLLTSLKFDLTSVKRSVAVRPKALGPRSQERLARALETTDLLFVRLRQIVRALRPPVLEELGLKAGLEALIADVQARTGLRCSLVFEQGERGPSRFPTLETALYRIVQELLTNVIRHARATNVAIAITSVQQAWRMTVKDDGIGFDVAGLAPTGGFGLRGLRERVEILGGQVEILSSPKTGTWVQVVIPVSSEPEPARVTDHKATRSRRRRRKAVDE
jgi:PAS domain S-box-containing protein